MVAPLTKSIVSPVLIGREPSLAHLLHLVDGVGEGRGKVALVSGEAGIGKSRLVSEARAYFRKVWQGAQTLQGRCFEPDRSLPYAPVLDLLRTLFVGCTPEQISTYLGQAAPEVVKLLPELSAILPGLVASAPLEPEMEKRRLHIALMGVLTQFAGEKPLMLTIEDLHWSDEASLEFLLGLARQVSARPMLLLLTYRSDETHQVLDNFLAALDREHLATEVALGRLTRDQVDAMVRAIFGLQHAAHSDFLTSTYTLTEGNPFFLEEVLKSLVASGDISYAHEEWNLKPISELHIPRSAQIAVQRRAGDISAEARNVLSLAAVAGRRFDFDLLQQITGLSEVELLGAIKELIRAQLVVEESADTFAFRHALTREAMYNDLLARERRGLHRQIAEAIERVYARSRDARLGDLAYHYYEAQAWEEAQEYARRAGDSAAGLHSPRAAVEHYTRAVEAARHLAETPPLGVLKARAQAYELIGDFEGARSDYTLILEAARATGDLQAEWQAEMDLGWLWTARDYRRGREHIERALELARKMDDHLLLAHTLNRVGNWHAHIEQPAKSKEAHQEALDIFIEVGDRRATAATLDMLGITSYMAGDVLSGVRYYTQAVPIFREIGDLEGLVNSISTLSIRGGSFMSSMSVGAITSLEDAVQGGEEAIAAARKLRWRAGEGMALGYLAHSLGTKGEYGQGFEVAQQALMVTREIEHHQWTISALYALGGMYLDILALREAQEQFEEALVLAKGIGSPFVTRLAYGFLARTLIAQGRLAEARSLVESVLSADTPMGTLGGQVIWGVHAELQLASGETAHALETVDKVIAAIPNTSGDDAGVIPHLWNLRGQALYALGKVEGGEAVLAAALQVAEARGLMPVLWRVHVSLGKMLRGSGRREEAEAHFSAARSIIEELANKVPQSELRSNFVNRANAMMPGAAIPTPLRAAKAQYGGLTGREREVAAKIAQGRSNQAIAAELFLSERTVEKHVENIMSKLGFAARSQVAAWVVEKGLG